MNAPQPRAKVYKTPTCPYCHMAVDYLRSLGVQVEEVDVSRDEAAAMEMVQKSGQMGVPVIEINGHIIIGFNRPAIDAALAGK
ncbi:MAG: glutathione S-transferase N-terminal domain-containing protein [Candidatus Micrarchaeota archaeon]|nr:glutathione S-transferase N-terminal domain-containing protein [Candidatus Micrarchaeota archaeon]